MDTNGLQVRFRDCTCPGSPHTGRDGADDGDIVQMRPALGFAAGAEALRLMGEAMVILARTGGGKDGSEPLVDTSRTAELVGPVYIREGVVAWNVVDENGPVPLDAASIAANYTWAYPIALRADELYSDTLTDPLVKGMNVPSRNGSNDKPTRQTRRSSQRAHSPQKSSSRNGSVGQPSPAVSP